MQTVEVDHRTKTFIPDLIDEWYTLMLSEHGIVLSYPHVRS